MTVAIALCRPDEQCQGAWGNSMDGRIFFKHVAFGGGALADWIHGWPLRFGSIFLAYGGPAPRRVDTGAAFALREQHDLDRNGCCRIRPLRWASLRHGICEARGLLDGGTVPLD